MLQVRVAQWQKAREVATFPGHDLAHGHLLKLAGLLLWRHGRLARTNVLDQIVGFLWQDVLPEPELRLLSRVRAVGPLHVLVHLGQGLQQAKVEHQDRPRDDHDEGCEGGVLEIRELHFHGSELRTPPNMGGASVGLHGRGLPADGLPVCRLDRLEVVRGAVVVQLHVALKDHQGVPGEEVGDVPGHCLVDALLEQQALHLLVDFARDVAVAFGARVNVGRYGVIAALALSPDPVASQAGVRGPRSFPSFRGRAIINGLADQAPAHIRGRQPALDDGSGCREGHHDGRQNGQLVVEEPGLVDVAGLECDLEAAASHAKSHAVHVDHWLLFCCKLGRLLVFEQRHSDVHFAPAPASDVARERAKPGVGVDAGVGHEVGLRGLAARRRGRAHKV
mmetsp:Transcript_117883/g.279744  ORF Transcript_117883/g.279744 Transcript_117883/m.279744 type:complete len:392 (+) Transcript_117883:748-1923(+)